MSNSCVKWRRKRLESLCLQRVCSHWKIALTCVTLTGQSIHSVCVYVYVHVHELMLLLFREPLGLSDAAKERVLVLTAKLQSMIANDTVQQNRIAELTRRVAELTSSSPLGPTASNAAELLAAAQAANDMLTKQVGMLKGEIVSLQQHTDQLETSLSDSRRELELCQADCTKLRV